MQERKQKILLVEDTRQFREIYADILRSDNYDVLEADEGTAALEVLKVDKPDLILTDIIMSPMGGIELLQNISEDDTLNDIPVIVLSVLGRIDDVKAAIKLGASDYIEKGTQSPRDILAKVREVLEKKSRFAYKILMQPKKYDAIKLLTDSGLDESGVCDKCNDPYLLEIVGASGGDNDFTARFVCSCNG